MKKLTCFLFIAALVTLGNAPMGKPINEIVLTANNVTSASDIEAAIIEVTHSGTRPGTVTLDSSQGQFYYTGDDRSINIFYSDITLRSLNRATIGNCADGVFFDDFTAHNIVVEGITFICDGCGVVANNLGPHHNALIRNNTFYTGSFPIEALQGDYWVITGNRLLTSSDAIHLYETGGTLISNNLLDGNIGVLLYNSGYDNQVTHNKITAIWQGVLLSGKTLGNRIANNRIYNVKDTGIAFQDIVAGNQIIANHVSCWPGFECQAVYAEPINYDQNKIAGNKLVQPK